ncbi:MAG: large repetitive protein [Solirubrobacteraceae bacterium]|nr:large repetitive protein [Solirubrobacteraceae bacterium]
MPKHLLRAVFLVALLAGTLGVAAPALAVDTPFSTRYAQTLRGDIRAVGNTLLSCPTGTANCATARNRTGASLNNNDFNMANVDVDSDASTFNSSTATVALPAGATVTWAGLYWSADTAAASGGAAAPTPAQRDSVQFAVGAGAYQTVTAASADLLTSSAQPTRFRGFRDVTSLLPASGNGTYSVANVQAGTGADRFAGWSLVVAYQDATQPLRRLNVFDGLGTVDATNTFTTTIAPFWTPASGPVTTNFGLLGFEGDAALATETATFNGTTLSNALNPANNFFNSTISASGAYLTLKSPNYRNQMGVDVDSDTRTGLLSNGQSSALLSFTSTQDYFMPSAMWLASDEGPAVNTAGPSVGGTARDGSTLTANPGTWDGTPTITYQYQWQRCDSAGANCVDIPGATNATYTLTPADVGSTVRVLVTALNDAGASSPTASSPTGAVALLAPSNTTVPAVSGIARDDQTLTTTIGGWSGTGPLAYDVQWQRCADDGTACVDIAGATAWSYVLTGADVGATVRSEVTASNSAGSAVAVSTPTGSVVPDPPQNTTVPAISGVPRDGQTVAATDGTWTGTDPITYTYQWQRCAADGTSCADIAGATASTYTLTGADVAGSVRVQVTATNVADDTTASSSATAVVVADPPANTSVPSLSGAPRDGQTLTLDDGTWSGTGPLDFDIVWQRCDGAGANCQAIPGVTGLSYTLATADIGATIRALVTASNDVGIAGPVATTTTAVVTADPPVNTTTPPSIGGSPVDGQTLTADEGIWTGTQPVVFTYQWQDCAADGTACTDIAGATNPTYTLTAGDIGSTVRVEVTAANGGGASTVASPVTAQVDAVPPSNTSPPTASGTAADGEVLTAAPGAWNGSDPITYTYQWERCDALGAGCQVIAGATSTTYTLADADAGQTVRVVVTGTNAGGTDQANSAPSAVVAGDPPVNAVAPTLSGSAVDGQTLTADPGAWSGTGTLVYAYQWQRCDASGASCSDIVGADDPTYTLNGPDIDGTVRAVVTVTNAWGIDHVNTTPSALVAAAPPAISIAPAVLGTAVDGQTVTADPGIWSGTPPVGYEYQWLRCDLDGTNCSDIPGAVAQDYLLTGADTGHGIRVEVTATNAAGTATASSPVASVDAAAPQSTTAPSVSGTLRDGQTVTADPGVWSGTGPITYEYQWLHCDATGQTCALIGGATEQTYTLGGSDVGGQVRVSVVATNAGGTAQASSPAGPAAAIVAADPPQSTSDPVVTGTATDGATLTAGNGGWTGTGPLVYTYQWQHCADDGTACADIAGATAATYTLASADVAGSVRVEVTATNSAGSDSSNSQATAPVAAAPPVSATPPAIAGPLVDGATLTADPGAFSGTTPQTFTYRWQRCDTDGTNCADIPSANADTYDLVAADVGAAVQVVVTATNAAGTDTATSVLSAEIQPLVPQNTTPPSITGSPLDGHTLTADPGTWTGTSPTFAYQWQRCDADGTTNCADILGATDPTYTLVPGDIGHALRVDVTAGNGAGSVMSGSAPTAPAQAAPPANTTVPTVSGTPEDGQTLTADPGTWSGTPTVTYTYQWQRCADDGTACADIAGETAATYTLTPADVGLPVLVEVTAHNAGGDVTATSAPTAAVAVDPPSSTTPASVTGTAVDGQTLTADPGTWTGTGTIDFTYQWQRCDATGANCLDVPGATDQTYTLGAGDLGSTMVVVVTAHNGADTASTSAASAPVAPQAPISTSAPTVSGTVGAGHTLTADPGTWDGTAPITFEYQWRRCDADGTTNCADIAGADESTYDLGLADVGHAIVVVVTATNPGGSVPAPSAPTAATAPPPPTNTVVPPAPAGAPVDGGTLTAADGTWTGDLPIAFTYQWQRCDTTGANCTDIAGADESTYTPTAADVGQTIVVVVTATNPGGPTSQPSTPTAVVAAAPPVNTTAPSITGTPADGGTLTAHTGTWTGTSPIDFEYQWQSCDAAGANCTDIAGATDDTFVPGTGDIGNTITVVVTAANDGGQVAETAAVSAVVVASAPADTSVPVVSGAVVLGGTLTASPGTWSGTPTITYTYQWQRCDADGTNCVDVAGATDPTYTLGAGDQGHTVVAVVTATNGAGNDTSTSAPSAVLPAPPVNATRPAVDDAEPTVGDTLTVDDGTWTGTGPFTYEYQWQRCDFFGQNCVDIVGETGAGYTLTDEDAGHVLTVVVTATNGAGEATTTSVPTPAVQPQATPTPTPTPTPTATPTPRPTATPTPARPGPRPPTATATAPPLLGSTPDGPDLGDVPGSLVNATTCQQLAGNAKYRRLALRGIGTVRVRAYTTGPATKLTPILVTTQISHAKTKRVRVRYTLDGRKLRVGRKPRYKAAIAPSRLLRLGIHKLKATVTRKGKGKRAKPIVLKLKTVSCRTLFTAQRWRTTAGAGLRLRIDSRTELSRLAFKVPAALLPRQTAKRRTVGFMRVFVAGQAKRKRYALKLAPKHRGKALLKANGRPLVRYVRGGLEVRGLPARSAVAELTIYRVTRRDGATRPRRYRLRAQVLRPGARTLQLSVAPRAPR